MWLFGIELVGGVSVLGYECEADGALFALTELEVFGSDIVVVHEFHHLLTYFVCSCMSDECAWHACSSYADHAVEAASSRHCGYGFSVVEQDVEDGLPYSDDGS